MQSIEYPKICIQYSFFDSRLNFTHISATCYFNKVEHGYLTVT